MGWSIKGLLNCFGSLDEENDYQYAWSSSGKLVQFTLSFPKEEETRVSLSIAETIKPVLVILAYK